MSFLCQLAEVSTVTRQMTSRDAPGNISTRMTNIKCSLIMLVYLLSLSSGRAFGFENRADNVIEMAANDGYPKHSKENRYPRKYVQMPTDTVKENLKIPSESAIKYFVTKTETEELNRNTNTGSTYENNNSQEETKDSKKHTFHSLATNPRDIDDVFQEDSRIDKLSDVYRVSFFDEFGCRPCKCYSTISQDVVAICKSSSLDPINAVLPSETHQLTISNSPIMVFNATDFLRYHIVQNLTLSENKRISTIANSSDNYQMLNVEHLNLSFNSIKDIMDRSLVMFPNLLKLSLEHNEIRIISSLTFEGLTNLKYLNLSRNPLSVLTIGWLDHLQKLEVLDVSCFSIWNLITPGLFSNLLSLHELFINGDWKNAKSYPNEEIARLRNLTLLSIDGISEHVILGPQIKNLTKLVTLFVGFSITKECRLKKITESFLENVPYLQTVRFSKCPLTSVDPNVYRNVKDLRSLEFVSTYPYDIFKALDGLSGLLNSSLKYLRLNNLIEYGCPFICLYGSHGKNLRNINLEVIDLSYNRIGYMDEEFLNALPQTLRALVLRGNELIEPSLLTDKLSHLENLQRIDLGAYTYPVFNDEVSDTVDEEFPQKQTNSMFNETYEDSADFRSSEEMTNRGFMNKRKVSPKNAPVCKELLDNDGSKYVVDATNITNPNSLQHEHGNFQATRNRARTLKYLLAPGFFEVNLKDLFENIRKLGYTNMTYIDFSYCALPSLTHFTYMPQYMQVAIFNGNYFRHIHRTVFQYNNSLKYLSLNNNVLGYMFAYTKELLFTNLNVLAYLDISVNMIYELSPNFFEGLNNLKYLIMADNKLNLLNINFSTTPKLEYLDLRKNSISWISKSCRDELDIIGSKPNHTLYIELTLNPLRCTCEGLEVLHWIWASNIHFLSKDVLRCVREDGIAEDMGNIEDRVRSLQRQCAGKSLIIVVCVSSLVVICFLVVFGVMYRYRWQLRYIRNIALSRFIGYKPRDTACSEYRFDAFIVYSDMSRRFVFGDCLQELEVKRGHKLCVDDRDFMPGTYDVSAIVSAIQNSRKTVLILSPDFYDEPFSEYSVKMALMEEIYQKRSVLYLCVHRPLPDDEMSKSYDLLMIMNRNNYTEFPPETETSDEVRRNFWDQLSEKIGHSVTKER